MIHKQATRDMTEGSIVGHLIAFSLPLMVGNLFQMLYNTVDSIVVGQYVSKEALAAVNSTTTIINMLVFFFNGFSVGCGVVIARYFGAKDHKQLHRAIETAMSMTFLFCVLFTMIGLVSVRPMLNLMSTPADVMDDAVTYLTIYFTGFTGLLIYNMGSGILRAVGDTSHPLMFLILTSLLNIGLDLLFVLVFGMGIAGVAWATVLSMLISAALTLLLLIRTRDVYRFSFRDLCIDRILLRQIFSVALPAAVQSVITAFSNTFVQAYVNFFGSDCMAGWGCYNKLDQFIMLPMSSVAMAATTFVSQNIGAGRKKRAGQGTIRAILLSAMITLTVAVFLFVFADPAMRLFTKEQSVIDFGVLFVRANSFFLLFNSFNHVMAGALRGQGDSRGPMIVMLASFVAIRQVYLFIVTRFIANTPFLVGFGYPVGWMCCFVLELIYYFRRGRLAPEPEAA